jgi:ERCC4-type nuclease
MLDKFKYTDKEKKELLNSLVVIVDSREQRTHIRDWLDQKKKPYIVRKLDYGDYSFYLPKNEELGIIRDLDFSSEIVFELKQHADEYVGNLSSDRKRIEKELALCPANLEIIIENCSYEDIENGNYRSKYSPKSAMGTLHGWKYKYNAPFIFMTGTDHTAKYITRSFYYYLRNILK